LRQSPFEPLHRGASPCRDLAEDVVREDDDAGPRPRPLEPLHDVAAGYVGKSPEVPAAGEYQRAPVPCQHLLLYHTSEVLVPRREHLLQLRIERRISQEHSRPSRGADAAASADGAEEVGV
jgi:hypothetical protein